MTVGGRLNYGTPAGGSASSVTVTGAGSSLTVGTSISIYRGQLSVLAGGEVTTPSVNLGALNAATNVLVSGAGSSLTLTGDFKTNPSNNSTGVVTLADGGALKVGGAVTLGAAATQIGVLNIGAATGNPAVGAGVLDTTSLTLAAGTGTLNFNHTDTDYQFSAPISGGGAINQLAGVTHLTGNSSGYTGVTTVSGGELHVDGILGTAASSVAVGNGATLGGAGTIGGNVSITNGVLAPGNGPGTLTINGALTLASTSTTNVEFGQSNVVGGPFNDLVKVGGNLTVAGTLNVAVTAGGVFDPGLYRVMSYGGTFIDNGLTLGATPTGSSVTLQTAIAGQVNLVNTGGLSVNFWDGDGAGRANNGVVDGGAGTWTAASTNWTVQTGAANAAYTPDAFVIFAAAPGAVAIDDAAAGAVHVGGLQFAVDGYSLNGDALTITGPAATIRVGDGTADGANYTATINAPIEGSAKLVKTDLGTLILTGNNTYTGGAEVAAGRLQINGVQTGGGASQVDAAGVLGGTGVLSGSLAVAGTLAPGGLTAPGTLTVQGDVVLASTAQLNWRLGQAGVAGGALNDLLVVDGNLTLDGTLNVAQSAGGSFGPGVYRLIDYTGSLTDNGLNVATLPGGWAGAIQTAIAGQVNLVSVQPPLTYTYWDGGDGAGDGTISGGTGVWRATTPNWTTPTGAVDGAFTAGGFAIFAANPGTVTVDGSQGPIHVSGLQFASDGYHLVGDAVTLDAGQDIVRVGDGTSAGAAFVATIGTALTGPGQLDKTDAGTLVLTGANSWTGGTLISGGTLQLGAGGTSGSIVGDVTNNGTVAFDRSDVSTFAGVISGGGTLLQIGSGTTTLTADSSAFAGQTQVRSGTLAVDGALGGNVQVLAGGRLTGTGVVGALANQGVVAPDHGVGTLTVAGNYAGQGGVLDMDVQLGGDASPADRLVVHGSTSGTTLIDIQRLAGSGGAVTSNGILLVQVDGASSGAFALKGDFKLHGEEAVVGGAYAYVLRKDAAGDWLLKSSVNDPPGGPVSARPVTLYQPGSPVYEALPQALLALNGLGTMRERIDGRQWSGDAQGDGVWGRLDGGHTHLEPTTSTTQADLDIDHWTLQFGVDHALAEDVAGGRLVGGLTAHYGEAYAGVSSPSGDGGIDAKGFGVGATLTWTTRAGAYVDAQAQTNAFSSDLTSQVLGKRAGDVKGRGYALSIETGQSFPLGVVNLTPQAQLSYSTVHFDRFTDSFGAQVSPEEGDSLNGRLGLALDHDWTATNKGVAGRVYGLINVKHEFLDSARVDVSGVELSNRAARTWGGLAAGGTYSWRNGRFAIYGEVSADTSLSGFDDSYDVAGTGGFRMRF